MSIRIIKVESLGPDEKLLLKVRVHYQFPGDSTNPFLGSIECSALISKFSILRKIRHDIFDMFRTELVEGVLERLEKELVGKDFGFMDALKEGSD